jgi:hypothetical protein
LKALVDGREEVRYGVTASRTTYRVLSKRVVVDGVAVVVAIAAIIGITTSVGTFGSWLFRDLLPIVEVAIIPPSGCPRAWVAVVGVVAPSIVLRLGRLLL